MIKKFRAMVNEGKEIALPLQVQLRLGIRPGDEVEFLDDDGHITIRKAKPEKEGRTSHFHEWRGYLKNLDGKDVDEIIRDLRGH